MFLDQQIPVSKLVQVIPKLGNTGMNSIAYHLQLPNKVVSSLSEQDLLSVVLSEIEKRKPNEVCLFRTFNDHPVGIPRGLSATDLNKVLERFGSLVTMDAPYTLFSYHRKIDQEFELLKNDAFKMNYSAVISTLTSKVDQRAELLRMFCTNRSMIPVRGFTRRCSLATFDSSFAIFNEKRNDLIEKVKNVLNVALSKKADVTDLRIVSNIAGKLDNAELKSYTKQKLTDVINKYEIPITKKNDGGSSFNLFLLPLSWQKTALLDDSVYDVWNSTTSEISKFETLKNQTPEVLLESHIKASKLIEFKTSEILTAKKRNSTITGVAVQK